MIERLEGLRREVGTVSWFLIFIILLFIPFPTVLGIALYYVFKKLSEKRRYSAMYVSIFGFIILFLAVYFKTIKLENFGMLYGFVSALTNVIDSKPFDSGIIWNWLFSFNLISFAISWIFLGLSIFWLNDFVSALTNVIDSKPFDSGIIWNWLFSFNLISFAISWIFLGLSIFWLNDTKSELVIKENKLKEKNAKVTSTRYPVDLQSHDHVLVTGTTGSGKTANLLNYVEERLKSGSFVGIVDGKGGTKEYDLYSVVKKLAKKYNRKIYVLNQTNVNDPVSSPYNPFRDLTATQVKDFLINMSEWESDHYKALASRYWQMMANIMITAKIPLNFSNIIYFSYRKNFLELIDNALKEDIITMQTYDIAESLVNSDSGKQAEMSIGRSAVVAEGDGSNMFSDNAQGWNTMQTYDIAESLVNSDSGKQAEMSIGRSAVVAEGDGSNMFSDNAQGWNFRTAYDENAVAIVLLNELKYGDFARSTGKLVVDDIKALTGQLLEHDTDRQNLIVLEEFGVYADKGMEGLLNRTRSAGIQTIVSMQTFADVDRIDKDLTRQVMGNCNDFLIMLNNDNDTAETLSAMIGTRKGIEQTRRTDDGIDTGQSSNKLIDQFILHPNDIKQIRKGSGEGYFYSKSQPNRVIKFKTKYVEV